MSKDIKNYIGGDCEQWDWKYFIYIFKWGVIGKQSRKDIGGCLEGPKFVFGSNEGAKKDVMEAIKFGFNRWKLNRVLKFKWIKNDFIIFYTIVDYQCVVTSYFKNNLFE